MNVFVTTMYLPWYDIWQLNNKIQPQNHKATTRSYLYDLIIGQQEAYRPQVWM